MQQRTFFITLVMSICITSSIKSCSNKTLQIVRGTLKLHKMFSSLLMQVKDAPKTKINKRFIFKSEGGDKAIVTFKSPGETQYLEYPDGSKKKAHDNSFQAGFSVGRLVWCGIDHEDLKDVEKVSSFKLKATQIIKSITTPEPDGTYLESARIIK